jgi:hypothetical protein
MQSIEMEKVKDSPYIKMLPPSKTPWRLFTSHDRVFAINPDMPPIVLHEDGWQEVEFTKEQEAEICNVVAATSRAKHTSPRNLRRLLKRAFGAKD